MDDKSHQFNKRNKSILEKPLKYKDKNINIQHITK